MFLKEVIEYVLLCRGHLEVPSTCPINLQDDLIKCWSFDPEDRPSFHHLVNVFKDLLRGLVRYGSPVQNRKKAVDLNRDVILSEPWPNSFKKLRHHGDDCIQRVLDKGMPREYELQPRKLEQCLSDQELDPLDLASDHATTFGCPRESLPKDSELGEIHMYTAHWGKGRYPPS